MSTAVVEVIFQNGKTPKKTSKQNLFGKVLNKTEDNFLFITLQLHSWKIQCLLKPCKNSFVLIYKMGLSSRFR